MSKRFFPWDVDQISLLPPSVLDYVPLSHPAHFVRDLVRDELDLEAIYASYGDARGGAGISPGDDDGVAAVFVHTGPLLIALDLTSRPTTARPLSTQHRR